ncbi:hypothetical protein JAAARDRAFT_212601 [Jaapia argillacea MUCL 33604]|uniref:Uncharacterized protein n=1 Tax=Jaapia argillacea MUCL 33604 TaxID=933084 RepID=A0A067QA20_9AGAM|nr:hypothetical protein JAAARDRAFT_212601 [Jaapia argillacea MUCL 33604]
MLYRLRFPATCHLTSCFVHSPCFIVLPLCCCALARIHCISILVECCLFCTVGRYSYYILSAHSCIIVELDARNGFCTPSPIVNRILHFRPHSCPSLKFQNALKLVANGLCPCAVHPSSASLAFCRNDTFPIAKDRSHSPARANLHGDTVPHRKPHNSNRIFLHEKLLDDRWSRTSMGIL